MRSEGRDAQALAVWNIRHRRQAARNEAHPVRPQVSATSCALPRCLMIYAPAGDTLCMKHEA